MNRDHSFGTIMDVFESPARAAVWTPAFVGYISTPMGLSHATELWRIFLDAGAMYAEQNESWLRDERFCGPLQSSDQSAVSDVRGVLGLANSPPDAASPLRTRHAELGADPHWVISRTLLTD